MLREVLTCSGHILSHCSHTQELLLRSCLLYNYKLDMEGGCSHHMHNQNQNTLAKYSFTHNFEGCCPSFEQITKNNQ